MGIPETPEITQADRLEMQNERILEMQAKQTEALNALGANLQWLIDGAKGIFQMFGNPSFMASIAPMMAGAMGNGGPAAGPEDAGPESGEQREHVN